MLVWEGNDEFKQDIDTFVRGPFENPHLYDKQLFPAKRIIAIVGRKGSDKSAAIHSYLKQNFKENHPFKVSVSYGETSAAVDAMSEIFFQRIKVVDSVNSALLATPFPFTFENTGAALIVERADILAYEPDNEKTMRFMLGMSALAKRAEMLVFLLFDRLLADPDTVMPTKHYRKILATEHIDVALYMGAPHAQFRQELLKQLFEAHITNANGGGSFNIVNTLSEGDYITLADQHTGGATPQQIRDFARRVFDNLTSNYPVVYCNKKGERGEYRELNMAVLESHMKSITGNLHILNVDGTKIEAEFEQGIRGTSSKQAAAVPAATLPPLPKMTAFTTDNVDSKAAIASLDGEKKKKKNKRSRSIVEEQEEEAPEPAPLGFEVKKETP